MRGSEFIPTIAPLVVAENQRRGNPLFSSVVIAQTIIETGWGESNIMMKANAVFGIKATSDWKGKIYNAKTQECYDGVSFTTITDSFRAYNSVEESISDYFDLITKSERYRKATIAESPLECITAIKNGGYATDPNYINLVMSLIRDNGLERYDNIIKYEIGKNYVTTVNLNVRDGAGTNNRIKKYTELTEDGKNHAFKQENAVIKTGTTVTCLDIKEENNNIWLKIPSGWIAGYYENKIYVR